MKGENCGVKVMVGKLEQSMVKLTLIEVGTKDLQAQAQFFLCNTATGSKVEDS